MPVVGLGYVGLDAHDLDAWRRFATEVLAMQVIECGADVLALRMDERCQRVLIQHGGFRSGPLGMGHAVFHVEDIDAASRFYRELLDLQRRRFH